MVNTRKQGKTDQNGEDSDPTSADLDMNNTDFASAAGASKETNELIDLNHENSAVERSDSANAHVEITVVTETNGDSINVSPDEDDPNVKIMRKEVSQVEPTHNINGENNPMIRDSDPLGGGQNNSPIQTNVSNVPGHMSMPTMMNFPNASQVRSDILDNNIPTWNNSVPTNLYNDPHSAFHSAGMTGQIPNNPMAMGFPNAPPFSHHSLMNMPMIPSMMNGCNPYMNMMPQVA